MAGGACLRAWLIGHAARQLHIAAKAKESYVAATQLLRFEAEIMSAVKVDDSSEFDAMSDEDLLAWITGVIEDLPPLLQKQFRDRLIK
ncbi:MAG TPA: hypothetical protein DFR83_06470 [Deltaproteobacteria bacterium]|nr:hypothetical protein [Deltaproteobacteria bacterium]